MNCAEFKEQVAAYALGALEPDEQAACDAHLAQPGPHQGCEQALAQARQTAARMTALLPPAKPGPDLWKRIEQRVAAEAPAPSASNVVPLRPRRPWREAVAWGLAAAAGAAFFVTTGQLGAAQREVAARDLQLAQLKTEKGDALANVQSSAASLADCRKAVESLQQGGAIQRDALALMDLPGTKMVRLAPVKGQTAQGTALVNLAENRALLVSAALSPQPGKDYELWILRGKGKKMKPIPAGLVRFSAEGVALAEFDRSVLGEGKPAALAVSLEPKGGSTTGAPSTVLMAGAVAG